MSTNARLQQVDEYLKNPNVKKYLDLLSYTEGTEKHGYHTKFGGGRLEDLSQHPNKIWGRTGDGATTATGRYQFLGSTYKEQQKKLGLPDFSPQNQDRAAVSLIMQRGALDDILKGDIDSANRKLSSTWASLPYNNSPHQAQKSIKDVENWWNQSTGNAVATHQPVVKGVGSGTSQTLPVIQGFTPPAQAVTSPAINVAEIAQNFGVPTEDFNPLDGMQTLEPDVVSSPQKYQAELAKAFGVEPSVQGAMPDYIGDLVRSIYDQA